MRIYNNSQLVERVKQYKYLGSLTTEYWQCGKDIKSRTEMGKAAFVEKKKLLTSKLNLEFKNKMVKIRMLGLGL